MQVKRHGSWWFLALALVVLLGVGFASAERKAQGVSHQELFQAIDSYLRAAGLQQQDLPKRVIDVKTKPDGHYLVHCEMYQGEAWFEVWQEGGKWQVRGAPPPR